MSLSFLSGRKFLIVGGNGFVGNRVAAKLIQHSAQVSVLSRKGPRFQYPENKKINWIIADVMDPELYKHKIQDADTIIHSLGTLVDTSITKFRAPGEPGTYEHINRDSLLKLLETLQSPKKVIYISSSNSPPFVHRYLSTKLEAEDALLSSKHEGYALRPGFIYDWELKKWSIGLRHLIRMWNKAYPYISQIPQNGTILQKTLQQFEQGQPTSLNKIAQAISYISYKQSKKRVLNEKDIQEASQNYISMINEIERTIRSKNLNQSQTQSQTH